MENKVNVALQIIPRSNTEGVYKLVDSAIEVIRRSGVKYKVSPFETVMEGHYDTLMRVAREAQEACFNAGAEDLMVFIKIQRSKNKDVAIEDKTGKYE